MDVGTARMLRTLINHFILDHAISVMFQTIHSNFKTPTNITSRKFHLGETFKSITTVTDFDYDESREDPIVKSHAVIYNVTVEEINSRDLFVTYTYEESYDIYQSGITSPTRIDYSDNCYVWLSDVVGIVE
jgi:hypothetical protein